MGRGLKLRQLAKPLDEARKDPKVNKAVLFVEDLFGREMKSKRDVLIINEHNKKEYLKVIEEDLEELDHRDCPIDEKPMGFVPLSPILSLFYSKEKIEEIRREINPDINWVIVTPKDLLNPIKLIKEHFHVWIPTAPQLKQIGSEDKPKWLDRLVTGKTAGIHMGSENLIILEEKLILYSGVHELIHAEDLGYLDLTNPLYSVIMEGRATFGQWLFNSREDYFILQGAGLELSALDTIQILIAAKRRSMFGDGGIIHRNLGYMRESLRYIGKKPGMLTTLDGVIRNLLREIKSTSIEDQRKYVPFTIAMAELAYTLKNPYAAFRITTEKQPRTEEELKNFKEFYKKEIEEYKGQD